MLYKGYEIERERDHYKIICPDGTEIEVDSPEDARETIDELEK